MEKEKGFDFDPEFSEYNPIFAEIESIKKSLMKKEKESFISLIVKKLSMSVVLPFE